MKPVFILGIYPRSGTNYLYKLLLQHPDCVAADLGGEDYLLRYIEHLQKYTKTIGAAWKPSWNNSAEKLRKSLGQGMTQFLAPAEETTATHYVTKTPLTEGLEYFQDYFEDAYLVLLVRDGKDVSESHVKTFGTYFDRIMRAWSISAERILDFQKENQCIVLRYEDVYLDTPTLLTQLFEYLDLDASRFDFAQAKATGVVGSSTFTGTQKNIQWHEVVDKDASFNPLNRSKDWKAWQHDRFHYLAAKQAEALGYETERKQAKWQYWTTNFILDSVYQVFKVYRFFRKIILRDI